MGKKDQMVAVFYRILTGEYMAAELVVKNWVPKRGIQGYLCNMEDVETINTDCVEGKSSTDSTVVERFEMPDGLLSGLDG